MLTNPYWNFSTMSVNPFIPAPILPQQMVTPPPQQQLTQPQTPPIQQAASPQPTINTALPTVWNWKVTDSYQHMLMESVPFDGTPVLFMLKNESIFYIVSMVDGKKMVNGYSFTPLDNASAGSIEPQLTPEEQTEQRFSKIEAGMAAISEQLTKLVEVQHRESSNEPIKETTVTRQPINQ